MTSMRTHFIALAVGSALAVTVGCHPAVTVEGDSQLQKLSTDLDGGGTEDSGASGDAASGPDCKSLADQAREGVRLTIENQLACKDDDDCTTTGLSASCFDSCSRPVKKSGAQMVQNARDKVEAAECKQFHELGCKLIIPPCVPPTAPTCVAGKCQ